MDTSSECSRQSWLLTVFDSLVAGCPCCLPSGKGFLAHPHLTFLHHTCCCHELPRIEKLLQFGQEGLIKFCCDLGFISSVCTHKMCNLLSSFIPSFPEVKMQNSEKQRLFFILKEFLDIRQYNPDAVSNPTELTDIDFPELHPTIHLTYQ